MTRASKKALLTRSNFRGNVSLMNSLVRQHRLTNDIANRKDMRHIGAHLPVDFDESAIGHGDPARSAAIFLPLGERPTACSTRS